MRVVRTDSKAGVEPENAFFCQWAQVSELLSAQCEHEGRMEHLP